MKLNKHIRIQHPLCDEITTYLNFKHSDEKIKNIILNFSKDIKSIRELTFLSDDIDFVNKNRGRGPNICFSDKLYILLFKELTKNFIIDWNKITYHECIISYNEKFIAIYYNDSQKYYFCIKNDKN